MSKARVFIINITIRGVWYELLKIRELVIKTPESIYRLENVWLVCYNITYTTKLAKYRKIFK